MRTDTEYTTRWRSRIPEGMKQLDEHIGFSYRQCIWELIYVLTIYWINIAIAIITLSQYSINPVKIHYEEVNYMFVYLKVTKNYGLTYWRTEYQTDLPYVLYHKTILDDSILQKFELEHNTPKIVGACNATWAPNWLHRRSMGGKVMKLPRVAIYFQT